MPQCISLVAVDMTMLYIDDAAAMSKVNLPLAKCLWKQKHAMLKSHANYYILHNICTTKYKAL